MFITINKETKWRVYLNVMMPIFQKYRWTMSAISCNTSTGIRGF